MGKLLRCGIALSTFFVLFNNFNTLLLESPPSDLDEGQQAAAALPVPRNLEVLEVCDWTELSSAKTSHFIADETLPDSEVKVGWLNLGMVRSCCAPHRCQSNGGDVFLAFFEGQNAFRALTQPLVHDFQNGSYAVLVPRKTLLPSGTYSLKIYLHQALNRSAYRALAGEAAWPVADVLGGQDVLDSLDLHRFRFGGPDLLSVYVHLAARECLPGTGDVHWRWPGGNLEAWRSAISELPSCHRQRGVARFPSARRLGGFWLSTKKMPCSGVGRKGCGAFSLLLPDEEFHHLYLERDCYYPIRDGYDVRKCLQNASRVLFVGDSTTQGLLQEAIGMYSEVRVNKDQLNKSDVCQYEESYSKESGKTVGLWSSPYCMSNGESRLREVTLGGRSVMAMPLDLFRKPKCQGLSNLADASMLSELKDQLPLFNVLVLHSCDHDLCVAEGTRKQRPLQQYWQNLQLLAKFLRKRAAGKRILWLSCAAQGNLTSTRKVTQAQVFKWRLDRLAFEASRLNGWEFIDGFSMYSTALPKSRWFDHRGIAGDLHTHSHCCPRGDATELEMLRRRSDAEPLPYRLAFQGGAGYLSKALLQLVLHQICS